MSGLNQKKSEELIASENHNGELNLGTTTARTPIVSLSSQTLPSSLLYAATEFGFLQLTHHSVPPHLVHSAESESLPLFPPNNSLFPQEFPLGFDDDHNSFCFDLASFTESTRSLAELTRKLEQVGMVVLEAVGFGNLNQVRTLMWVSKTGQGDEFYGLGQVYPYIIGIQCQIRCQKVSLLTDSGWISLLPEMDSILVTFGDIAQVWSNGKIKKVRGRPVPIIYAEGPNNSNECGVSHISMSLLLTLSLDSVVSPLFPSSFIPADHENDGATNEDTVVFDSFSFEDYAWRLYHERFHLKDPLDLYRLV